MSAHAVVVIALMIGIIFSIAGFYKTPFGKRAFQLFFLHVMIISPIIKKINLARFARVLSSLLKSGVPIVQGLEVSGNSLSNIPYRDIVMNASSDVKLGKPLADSLGKDNSLFPILVVQMLQVGEESGTVEEILEQLANHYEEEVDTTLRNLSSIIEPLLLLVIGGIVGVLAVALISPIYNISQNIK
jgi:type IV pilus assembly protein PilC